ncbi:MAG: hypothetical protein NTY38_29785, partial [Acidobacteria bacterium]|nr:hypothetical protein [Acidobacteriota bacterium]
FNANRIAQLTTDANGSGQINFQPQFGPVATITATAGNVTKSASFTITNPRALSITDFAIQSAPAVAVLGAKNAISISLGTLGAPVLNQPVTFEITAGNGTFDGAGTAPRVTVNTDTKGIATAQLTPASAYPMQIRITVPGTGLNYTMLLPVARRQ